MSILQIKLIKDARYEEHKEYDVLYETPLQSGYTDVTDLISGWHQHGLSSGKDYKFVRKQIQDLIVDFDLLTEAQKIMCAEFMAPDLDKIVDSGVLGSDLDMWIDHWIEKSEESRSLRINAFKNLGYQLVTEKKKLLNNIITDGLFDKYIAGIENKAIDGEVGFYDWVESKETYSAAGLINGGFTPIDSEQTMSEISVLLMDIVKNGNY